MVLLYPGPMFDREAAPVVTFSGAFQIAEQARGMRSGGIGFEPSRQWPPTCLYAPTGGDTPNALPLVHIPSGYRRIMTACMRLCTALITPLPLLTSLLTSGSTSKMKQRRKIASQRCRWMVDGMAAGFASWSSEPSPT